MNPDLRLLPGFLPQSVSEFIVRLGPDDDRVRWVDAVDTVDWPNLEPARAIRWWRGQTSRPGWQWTATNGALVFTESQHERNWLLFDDFDPATEWIRSQPFGLLYPAANGKARCHYPDFLCGLTDGRCRVVDVHAPFFVNDSYLEQCAATKQACAEVGWEYVRREELPRIRFKNLKWLHTHARPLHPQIQDWYVEALLEVTERPSTVADACAYAGEWTLSLSVLGHLIWHRLVQADLDQLLQPSSIVWRESDDADHR